MEEWRAAYEAVLVAERELAEERSEPFAVPIEFPVRWDVGAPLPTLLKNDYRTFVVFRLKSTDPNWDGSDVNIVHTDGGDVDDFVVVEFKHCVSAKMGSPNDEVSHGHPLFGKGYQAYTPLQVRNSSWTNEIERMNSVHRGYDPQRWRNMTHYIFGFHDSTFECMAESLEIEFAKAPMTTVLEQICARLLV